MSALTITLDEDEYLALARCIACMTMMLFTKHDFDEHTRLEAEAHFALGQLGNERYNRLMNRMAAQAATAFPHMEFDRLTIGRPKSTGIDP